MKKKILKDPFADREAAKYENPIPSRELISDVLSKASGPLKFQEIIKSLQIDAPEHYEAMQRRLGAMVRDGQLISNRKGEYILIGKVDLIRGRVQGHRDGFGFVIPLDGSQDIYIAHRQMQKVFDGDEVLVRPGRVDFKGRQEGKIVEVLVRNTQSVVGRYMHQAGIHFVRPDNPRNCHDVVICHEETQKPNDGQFVVVEILEQPDRYKKPVGRIKDILGDHMAPGMEIDVAIHSYSIPNVWPDDVKEQCADFTPVVKESDKQHRIDIRHLPLVTIDGEDARDFDDAVYCETKPSGGWRLYVAIADVSHYVPVDSPLDKEATVRGNSVYFPDYVVPMLPEVLSNGLCSLNPHVDRLCMVCEMTVSAAGKISGYKFYEAVMHSHARLTYTEVGKIISAKDRERAKLRDQYSDLVPHLDQLYALYKVLRKTREERSAIDFETNETRIIFDANRKIEKIVPVCRNEAHKLIEECMLAANVCAAKLLESVELPALYRVHEGPSDEKLEKLCDFLGGLGLGFKGRGKIKPEDFCQVLSQIGERPDAHLIQTVMLRSMNQARYQADNLGHFGLAYTAYTHFTSPIRRYPDLIVHRAIRALLYSDVENRKLQRSEGTPRLKLEKKYPYQTAAMVAFGEQCSTTERRADEATRDVVNWLKCEFLRERVGETFDGVVSAVTPFGLFVELNELYVEGLIHISSLPHDYYYHEPAQHRLVGERTRKVFRLGDAMKVQVAGVNLDERKIDFDFIKLKSRRKNTVENTGAEEKPLRKIRKRKINKDTGSDADTSTSKKSSGKKVAAKKVAAKKGAVKKNAAQKTLAKKTKKAKKTKRKSNKKSK